MLKVPTQGTLNGIAGVHLVAAELSTRGYSVAVTSRNTPGVDLFATSPRSKKTFSIQVKTNGQERTPSFWLLGSNPVVSSPDYFFVFVNIKRPPKSHEFYIVASADVLKHSAKRRAAWNSFYRKHAGRALYAWRRLEGRSRSPYRSRLTPAGRLCNFIWTYLRDAGTPIHSNELKQAARNALPYVSRELKDEFDHNLQAALARLQSDRQAIHCEPSGVPARKGSRTNYWKAP